MQRDMDLIRDILMTIERGDQEFSALSSETADILSINLHQSMSHDEADKLEHHLELIEQAGFATFYKMPGGDWVADALTWKGHDFVDSVRDPEIWAMTKDGVQKAGGFTADVLVTVAKGIVKKQLACKADIEIVV